MWCASSRQLVDAHAGILPTQPVYRCVDPLRELPGLDSHLTPTTSPAEGASVAEWRRQQDVSRQPQILFFFFLFFFTRHSKQEGEGGRDDAAIEG